MKPSARHSGQYQKANGFEVIRNQSEKVVTVGSLTAERKRENRA